jgi:ribosomal protein S27AE
MLDAELTLKKIKIYIRKTEKIGREYKGKCPFCRQNNFYINLNFDGRFNCFSCGYIQSGVNCLINDIRRKKAIEKRMVVVINEIKTYKAKKELRRFVRCIKEEFKITKNYL